MRTPPLLADFIHHRVCKPICEKLLTLPGRMATAIDALEATTNALVEITEKLKLAQQTTEEMFISAADDDEDSPEN